MTTLKDFLATADADSGVALAEAQAYESSQGSMISSDVMTMLLVSVGMYGYFRDCSVNSEHPARDICLALMDRMRTQSDFNFMPNHPKGAANNGMIELLIDVLMTEKAAQLTALRDNLRAEAGFTTYPFDRTTLSNVLTIRSPGVEVETGYPSESYLISSANQGIDIEVVLTDPAVADLTIEAYLETCSDTSDQNIPENFVRHELSVGNMRIKAGETRGFLALSNRKVRSYNRVFIKPQFSADLTASVRNNRG